MSFFFFYSIGDTWKNCLEGATDFKEVTYDWSEVRLINTDTWELWFVSSVQSLMFDTAVKRSLWTSEMLPLPLAVLIRCRFSGKKRKCKVVWECQCWKYSNHNCMFKYKTSNYSIWFLSPSVCKTLWLRYREKLLRLFLLGKIMGSVLTWLLSFLWGSWFQSFTGMTAASSRTNWGLVWGGSRTEA